MVGFTTTTSRFQPAGPLRTMPQGLYEGFFPDGNTTATVWDRPPGRSDYSPNPVDVILCRPDLAFVILTQIGGLRSVAINPQTGRVLSHTDAGNQFYLYEPGGYVANLGEWQRLDDHRACMVSGRYTDTTATAASGRFMLAAVSESGWNWTAYSPQYPAQVLDANVGPWDKDTGQSLWIDATQRRGVKMYYPSYGYSGGERTFSATCQAIEINFDTLTATETPVHSPNLSRDVNSNAEAYYGILAVPGGRSLSIHSAGDDYTVVDQDNAVIDRIIAADLSVGAGGYASYLYQAAGSDDIVAYFAFGAGTTSSVSSGAVLFAQRYETKPTFRPVGGRILMTDDWSPSHTTTPFTPGDAARYLAGAPIIDCENQAGVQFRTLNLPYAQILNHEDGPATGFYVGVEALLPGDWTQRVAVGHVDMSSAVGTSFGYGPVDTRASAALYDPASKRTFILYTWMWPDPAPTAYGQFSPLRTWYQLWAADVTVTVNDLTVGPPAWQPADFSTQAIRRNR